MATLILVSKSPYFTKDDTYAFEASLNLRKMDEEVGLMLIRMQYLVQSGKRRD